MEFLLYKVGMFAVWWLLLSVVAVILAWAWSARRNGAPHSN
jgi:hypothetical protein